jgi:hypothetical protein
MSMHDDEPELAGYDPGDGRPLRSRKVILVMRVIVVVGLLGLVVPQIFMTVSVAANSAQEACRRWVKYEVPGPSGSSARFEIFGAGGIGWNCYTQGAFGGDRLVAVLGLIPGPPQLPSVQPQGS